MTDPHDTSGAGAAGASDISHMEALDLLCHMRTHAGYRDCGRDQMTTRQKAIYDSLYPIRDAYEASRAESRAEGREDEAALRERITWLEDTLAVQEKWWRDLMARADKACAERDEWRAKAEAKESAAGDAEIVERGSAALEVIADVADALGLPTGEDSPPQVLEALHQLQIELAEMQEVAKADAPLAGLREGYRILRQEALTHLVTTPWGRETLAKADGLAGLPPPPGAEARPQKVGHWWCDQCAVVVPPEDVTYEEFHEHCDYKVTWKPEEPAGAGRAGEISAHVHMDADAPPEVREAVHELIVKAHEQLAEKPCEYDRLKAQRDAMEARDFELVKNAIIDAHDADTCWTYDDLARAAIKALRGGAEGGS